MECGKESRICCKTIPKQIENLIYTAGYLDADGSISIYTRKPSNKYNNINPIHYLEIKICSINFSLIDWLKETFGGYITSDKSQHKNILYSWKPKCIDSQMFLISIEPFLKTKKEQCRLAINFLKEKEGNRKQLTGDILNQREFYRKKISELNWKR